VTAPALPPDTSWAPHAWRDLLSELNGRAPDGTRGIRDVDNPCNVYEPVEIPGGEDANGDCETDGHYLCADGRSVCRHISREALRRRRERCEECGTKLLAPGTHRERCPSCDPKIKLFSSTVARPDLSKPDHWLLMNRRDRGYAESAHGPFPSLEAITEEFAVRIGDLGADKHGAFVRMEIA